jgi:hypothetical protein
MNAAVRKMLASRTTRVALVTVLAAVLARRGLLIDSETLAAIVAVGCSLILGIAHEDSGAKRGKQ